MNRSADAEAIDRLIADLGQQIVIAARLGCEDATRFLKMSKLTLQMERHSISDSELKAFIEALETPDAESGAFNRIKPARNYERPRLPVRRRGL